MRKFQWKLSDPTTTWKFFWTVSRLSTPNILPLPVAYLALVQAPGGSLVFSLHVGGSHALVSSRPYCARGVVCVAIAIAMRSLQMVRVSVVPCRSGEDNFLASPFVPTGERSTHAAC